MKNKIELKKGIIQGVILVTIYFGVNVFFGDNDITSKEIIITFLAPAFILTFYR